jgi:iron(II)-dependent oxidoreductase
MTPSSLLASLNKIVQLNQKYENFPFWLAVALQDDLAQRVVDTQWFKAVIAGYREGYSELRSRGSSARQATGGETVAVEGLRFMSVPGGQLLQGDGEGGFASVQLPHPVSVPPFLMSEVEISNGLYETFTEENPEWTLANKSSLAKEKLVDDQYLSDWSNATDQANWKDLPVTNVSFYAAQAFCSWLTSKLPTAYSGYSVRLPFESEWEWAARGGLVGADYPTGRPSAEDRFLSEGVEGPSPVGGSLANGYGLRDMTGNVWEWCLDWYSPVKYLFSSLNPDNNSFDSSGELPIGAAKVIRGGSWANEQELIKVSTRGSQPPEWCTPYLGFRVVMSRYTP